jgi:hypothetical protein
MTAQAWVHRSYHELPEHLAEALAAYRAAQGRLPPRITVHKSQVGAAEAALPAGAEIAVEGLGGCLANEIWLWLPDEEEEEDI